MASVVLAPVLYGVRKLFLGNRAKFSHAIWIAVLGVIIGAIVGFFLGGIAIVSMLIMIVVWLVLIKHFFNCGLLRGVAIAIIADIIYLIISLIISAILARAFFVVSDLKKNLKNSQFLFPRAYLCAI